MLNSPVIEVLIGIIFIYSILSILVTQLNAVISTTLRIRAKHLRDGIYDIIQDDTLKAKIVSHPLIRLVKAQLILPKQVITDEVVEKVLKARVENVSCIDPKTFVNVLISVIRVSSDKELYAALLTIVDGMPDGEERRRLRIQIVKVVETGDGADLLGKLIASLSDETYKAALTQNLRNIQDEITKIGLESDSMVALLAGLRNIKNPYFRSGMDAILSTSNSLGEAEIKIEQWFNDGMSRATEAFTQRMQRWSLITGFIIAILINVDTLFIAETLWNDSALRAIVATTATGTIEQLQTAEAQAQSTITSSDDTTIEDVEQAIVDLGDTAQLLVSLRLPMGWVYQDPNLIGGTITDAEGNSQTVPSVPPLRNLWYLFNPFHDFQFFLYWLGIKVFGLCATMIAIAQGAPFWFGVFRRVSSGGKSS